MQISVTLIKELREKTNAGVMECKNALLETGGDLDKACDILQEKGWAKIQKKAGRVVNQGVVEAYIHGGGRVGVLIEVNCETDFVARTDEFKTLAHDLALQVAAMAPRFISADEIPEDEDLEPKEVCLLEQPFVKDPSTTLSQIITDTISKTGEMVSVRRFSRFELGK